MFDIGEKIFYPMHGAAVIEAIEEKEVLGETKLYYIMTMINKKMNVMIPAGQEESLGIRKIVNSDILEDALLIFNSADSEQTTNHSQRHRLNLKKIQSGDIYEGIQVIHDLIQLSKIRSLGTDDRNMLNHAQQILISELVLVKGIDQEKAENMLNTVINN